jgi:hypothetical protein
MMIGGTPKIAMPTPLTAPTSAPAASSAGTA